MPDPPIKPPNKRINELVTEITNVMWGHLKVKEMPKVRDNKMITFLIRKLAILEARIEELEK
jgi:hypothetical protein